MQLSFWMWSACKHIVRSLMCMRDYAYLHTHKSTFYSEVDGYKRNRKVYLCRNTFVNMQLHDNNSHSFWSICSGETWKFEFRVLSLKYGINKISCKICGWDDWKRLTDKEADAGNGYLTRNMWTIYAHEVCVCVFVCRKAYCHCIYYTRYVNGKQTITKLIYIAGIYCLCTSACLSHEI